MDLAFKKQFHEQLFSSERRRILILIGIILFGLCYQFVNVVFIKQPEGEMATINSVAGRWLFPSLIIILESIFLIYLGFRAKKKKKHIPLFVQYVNVTLEISLLFFFIIVVALEQPQYDVLNSPAVFICFLFIILSTMRLNFLLCFYCGTLVAGVYAFTAIYLYNHFSLIDTIKVIVILLSGLAAGLVAIQIKSGINTSLKEMEKHNRLANVFGQQISKEVAETMIQNEGVVQSRRMHVAVMFIDVRNFTRFTVNKTPEEIVKYQNDFLSIVISCTTRHGGIVNQILGDGCMITFGAPLEMENPSFAAVRAATDIITSLQKAGEAGVIKRTKVGIGIHCGDAVTGNIGNEIRQQYSITGQVVIIASRIEQLNKEFNSQLLITEDVMRQLKDVKIQNVFMGNHTIKGFESALPVYKVI